MASERLTKEREAEHRHCAHNMTAVSSDRLRECLAELDAVRTERDQALERVKESVVHLECANLRLAACGVAARGGDVAEQHVSEIVRGIKQAGQGDVE